MVSKEGQDRNRGPQREQGKAFWFSLLEGFHLSEPGCGLRSKSRRLWGNLGAVKDGISSHGSQVSLINYYAWTKLATVGLGRTWLFHPPSCIPHQIQNPFEPVEKSPASPALKQHRGLPREQQADWA